jgi:hypothetical protein
MPVVILMLSLCMLLLPGCAVNQTSLSRQQFAALPHRYDQFDMSLAWESTQSTDGVIVEGIIRNKRWRYAEGLEVWVSLLGPDGRVLAREVALITPNPLNIEEQAPFGVRLPVRPVPGARLAFTYRYDGVEDTEGSASWMQSFEAPL